MQQLSLFRGVHDTQPRPVTLEEVVTMMRTDQSVRDLTEKHRYARATGDEQGASRYKKMMTSFGVAARFEGGRQQRHIVEYTGLSLADFDHIPEERMAEVLAMVREDEHTLLAYTTLSGQGVRILFQYKAPSTPPEGELTGLAKPNSPLREGLGEAAFYKQAFLHGNAYYEALTGLPYDPQCKNVGRISTIAYDEEVYYNPEATPFIIKPEEKKSVGRPRKVERLKMNRRSTPEGAEVKVESCATAVLRELEQRGVVYGPGTHNKYISDACYMMNRYGVSESDCTAWALDKFADYQAEGNDVASIVRSCYQQTEEHGTARPPKADTGKQATVAQIEAFLAERVALRRNVVTGFVEVKEASPNPSQGGVTAIESTEKVTAISESPLLGRGRGEATIYRQFTDDDRNSLWRALSKELGVRVVRQDISAVVKSDFSPRYHPFEDYINRLLLVCRDKMSFGYYLLLSLPIFHWMELRVDFYPFKHLLSGIVFT